MEEEKENESASDANISKERPN
jgi:hypothetical protein